MCRTHCTEDLLCTFINKLLLGSVCAHYLQYVVKLGLELKVRFGFQDDSFEGLLQHLNPSLSFLTGVCDTHMLPLAAESLLLCFVHLRETIEDFNVFLYNFSLNCWSFQDCIAHSPSCCTYDKINHKAISLSWASFLFNFMSPSTCPVNVFFHCKACIVSCETPQTSSTYCTWSLTICLLCLIITH